MNVARAVTVRLEDFLIVVIVGSLLAAIAAFVLDQRRPARRVHPKRPERLVLR
jgi:hypothetical protein